MMVEEKERHLVEVERDQVRRGGDNENVGKSGPLPLNVENIR